MKPEDKSPSLLEPLANEYRPSPGDRERLRAAIQARLAGGTSSPDASRVDRPRPWLARATGPVVGLLAAGGMLAIVSSLHTTSGSAVAPAYEAESPAPSLASELVGAVPLADSASTPAVSDSRRDPEPSPPRIVSVAVSALPSAKRPTPVRNAPLPSAAVDVGAIPSTEAEPSADVAAPVVRASAPVATSAREPEGDFLRRAQARLTSSPLEALVMTSEHPSLYPNSILVQEREVIAIDALVRLGRRAEAVRRANAFRRAFPRSAHMSRVATMTEQL